MKEFLENLIKSQIKTLQMLLKQYKKQGGDPTTFGFPDPEECRRGFVKNDKGECVPDEGR